MSIFWIEFSQRNITRLSGRYSDCRKKNRADPSEFTHDFDYSLKACLNACYQGKLRYECGCVNDVMGNTTICSTLDRRQGKWYISSSSILLDGRSRFTWQVNEKKRKRTVIAFSHTSYRLKLQEVKFIFGVYTLSMPYWVKDTCPRATQPTLYPGSATVLSLYFSFLYYQV